MNSELQVFEPQHLAEVEALGVFPSRTAGRATAVRRELREGVAQVAKAYLRLGLLLLEARARDYARQWTRPDGTPYLGFAEFVAVELGVHERKARYLAAVARTFLVDLRMRPEQLAGVPWSKAAELRRVVTQETVAAWVEEAKSSTVDGLKAKVRAEVARQAVARGPGGEAAALPAVPEALRRLTVTLVGKQVEVVEAAFARAGALTGWEKAGSQLEAICADYLAGNGGGVEDVAEARATLLEVLGAAWGVRLEALPLVAHPVEAAVP